jgi:hypothetical protein
VTVLVPPGSRRDVLNAVSWFTLLNVPRAKLLILCRISDISFLRTEP